MKVKSMFTETIRFVFTRRIKGADGKMYRFRYTGVNSDIKRYMPPQLIYANYLLLWLYLFISCGFQYNLIAIGTIMLILMPFFRFGSYWMSIKSGCDVWECDTVPDFGFHPFRESMRGAFLFRCKDIKGEYHRLSLVKYGLPTLWFCPILIAASVFLGYAKNTRLNLWIMALTVCVPIFLYGLLLDAYEKLRDRRSCWEDVNAPQADDTEGGSEYKL